MPFVAPEAHLKPRTIKVVWVSHLCLRFSYFGKSIQIYRTDINTVGLPTRSTLAATVPEHNMFKPYTPDISASLLLLSLFTPLFSLVLAIYSRPFVQLLSSLRQLLVGASLATSIAQ